MCQTFCILLGLKRNDRDVMVNFKPGQCIHKKHISPRCNCCKPNLYHSPLKGKTIIFLVVLHVPIQSCIWPGSPIKGMVYYRLLSGAQSPVYDCILTTKHTGLSLYQWCGLLLEQYLPFVF